MDEKPGKPFQFGLKSVFAAVAVASILACLFRWLATDMAVSVLLCLILLAPIAYYLDWRDALRTAAWTALLTAVLFAGCTGLVAMVLGATRQ
jgi:hypothetical protein